MTSPKRGWTPLTDEQIERAAAAVRALAERATANRLAKRRSQAKGRAEINAELLERGIIPTYDPRIIGEHEVEPVRCPCCRAQIPWHLVKGWRS